MRNFWKPLGMGKPWGARVAGRCKEWGNHGGLWGITEGSLGPGSWERGSSMPIPGTSQPILTPLDWGYPHLHPNSQPSRAMG